MESRVPPSLLSLMLVVFGLTTGEFVIAGILPDVAADLGVSVPAAGRLVSAYALGMIVGGPVVTVLTARVPRKPLVIGLIAVSVLGNLGSALAPNYPVLLAARFAAGLVVATFFAVAIATAASMAPAGRESSTIAKVALGLNLGIVLGAPLGTVIGQTLGWRATFGSVAALTTVGLLMVLRFVPALPAAATGPLWGELRVFAGRDVRLAIALTALGNVGVVTVFTYIAPLLTEVGGFPEGAVPVLLLVYGAGAVAGNFLGGRLSDRALMPSLAWPLGALAAALALFCVAEARRAHDELGATGLSVIPFLDGVDPADPRHTELWRLAADRGVPVWMHCGQHFRSDVPIDVSAPRVLDRIAGAHPGLVLVAGHGGWPWVTEMLAVAQRHADVHLEFSSHRPSRMAIGGSGWDALLSPAARPVRDRVMFGSTSWTQASTPAALAAEVTRLGLPGATARAWLHGNAERLLARARARTAA
ncbi:hypothetical protein GCM10023178_65760 [Actinomadura luteofluorescens]